MHPVNGIADLAQLAERKLPKLQVAGSSPVIRSNDRKLSSVGSERLPYKQEVAGSNPAVSTNRITLRFVVLGNLKFEIDSMLGFAGVYDILFKKMKKI